MTKVLIPWRATPSRVGPLREVTRWYEDAGHTVHLFDSDGEIFQVAAARNIAMASMSDPDEVVIISDADTFPEVHTLNQAIEAAKTSTVVHLPYTEYHTENSVSTSACSGVMVTTPRVFFQAGGMDERFIGWAPEDFAFLLAHDTLVGRMVRHEGKVTALSHDPASTPDMQSMQDHYHQYRIRFGNKPAMQQFVADNHNRLTSAP